MVRFVAQFQVRNSGECHVVKFQEQGTEFRMGFGDIQTITKLVGGEVYAGEYNVVPRPTEQVLNTKDKIMINDLKVFAIPYAEVSNTTGGITVTIGDELKNGNF